MQNLRAILDGKREDPLSKDETTQLVTEICGFKEWVDKSKSFLYINEGLAREKINPDILITSAIPEISKISDFIFLSLAYKNGANRNLYYLTPKIGPAHIIVYTVVMMRDRNRDTQTILLTLLLLRILGVQTIVNAFDQNANRVESEYLKSSEITTEETDSILLESVALSLIPGYKSEKPKATFTPKTLAGALSGAQLSMSVQDWLKSQGLEPLDNLETDISKLRLSNPDMLSAIGTICDREDLAYRKPSDSSQSIVKTSSPRGATQTQNAQMIESAGTIIPSLSITLTAKAKSIIKNYPLNSGLRIAGLERGVYIGLTQCIEYCNLEGFIRFLNLGQIPNYFTINSLVINLKNSFRGGDLTLTSLYQSMLGESISRGADMDLEQISIISNTSDSLAQYILQIYRQPMWKKACTVPFGTVSDSLRTLGFNLNIDYHTDKSELCSQLRNFSEADTETLKNSAILRQKIRIGAGVSMISDFVTGVVPNVACQNRTSLQKDPFGYNDLSLSFFNDNGSVYCFTSDTYEALLTKGVNPHKPDSKLSQEYLDQIKMRLEIIKRFGINPSNPTSVSQAIDQLDQDDEITTRESDFIVSTIEQSAQFAGIEPSVIKSMNLNQMCTVLATIGMEQSFLEEMSGNHRYITFLRAAYTVIKLNPQKSKLFFDSVKMSKI